MEGGGSPVSTLLRSAAVPASTFFAAAGACIPTLDFTVEGGDLSIFTASWTSASGPGKEANSIGTDIQYCVSVSLMDGVGWGGM